MQALRLLPVVLVSLVLGAHALRRGWLVLALLLALLPLLLLVRRPWAARTVEVVFALGALEWLRTLVVLVELRRAHGMPYLRLVAILGSVTLITGAAVPLVESWWRRRAGLVPAEVP